jgi:O-antigen/teichoic acid export membrane protein
MEKVKFRYTSILSGASLNCINFIIFYLLGLFLANVLNNPAEYGNYVLSLNVMLLLSSLIIFGHDRYILEIYSFYLKKNSFGSIHGYLKRIIQITLMAGILIAILFATTYEGYKLLVDPNHHHPIIIGILFTPMMALVLFCVEIFNVNKRFIFSDIIYRFLLPIIAVILILIFFWFYKINTSIAIACIGSAWVIALIILIANIMSTPMRSVIASKPIFETKRWLLQAAPYWIYQVIFHMSTSLGIILLELIGNSEAQVGIFAAAYQTVSFFILISLAATRYTLPLLAQHLDDRTLLQEILNKRRNFMLIVCTVFAIVLIFGGKYILALFGQEYIQGYSQLITLLVGFYIMSLFAAAPYVLQFMHFTRIMMIALIVYFIICLTLSLSLIPFFGGVGAALAFTVSTVFYFLYMTILVHMRTGLRLI